MSSGISKIEDFKSLIKRSLQNQYSWKALGNLMEEMAPTFDEYKQFVDVLFHQLETFHQQKLEMNFIENGEIPGSDVKKVDEDFKEIIEEQLKNQVKTDEMGIVSPEISKTEDENTIEDSIGSLRKSSGRIDENVQSNGNNFHEIKEESKTEITKDLHNKLIETVTRYTHNEFFFG